MMPAGVTYQIEGFSAVRAEAEPLMRMEWEELGSDHAALPFAPDWLRYKTLADAGILTILTVRQNGVLIGHAWGAVRTPLHYATSKAYFNDFIYIKKEFRVGMAGVKMVKELERHLMSVGCDKVYIASKLKDPTARDLLGAMGYAQDEVIMTKVIGGARD